MKLHAVLLGLGICFVQSHYEKPRESAWRAVESSYRLWDRDLENKMADTPEKLRDFLSKEYVATQYELSYAEFLLFVRAARAKGARPIESTPVVAHIPTG